MKIILSKALLVILGVLYASMASAQNKVVQGTVSDDKGELPGVVVREKGSTTNAVPTDVEGKFKITLKGNSGVLQFSMIGYTTQEITVGNRTTLKIMLLSDAKALEDVVVVGYGKQKKITLTGSVSQVSGAELRENPSASLQNTLAGKLPGFFSQQRTGRPGADGATFFIRGVSTYNSGATTPLIIVDDIEYTADQFSLLDANEVETISILKDASTTAVYGIKGANGVVVVTTRRGKIGAPAITFRSEMSFSQPTVMPEYLNSYDAAVVYNQAKINDGQVPRWNADDLQKFKDHSDPYGHPDINWKDVLFKDFSKQIKGNFDISGGTEKVKYFVSAGYLWQDGLVKNYSDNRDVNSSFYYKRYNYRSNLDIKATKTLDVRLDLYGNFSERNTPNVGSAFGYNDVFYDFVSFRSLAPWAYPIYNPDGSFGYSTWQRDENSSYNQNNVVGRLTYYGYNRNFNNNMNFVAQANQKLDFITKGLSLKGVISYNSTVDNSRSMTTDQFPSFIYNPVADTYAPRDVNIYRLRRQFLAYGAGSTVRTLNMQAFLNYDRTFSKDHHVSTLVLFNQQTKTAYSSNSTYNFVDQNFRGTTGRIGYDYKSKYLFQLNGAYNGSDRFVSDKRFGFFPAVSAGWNISEEPFFKNTVEFVDQLKIRGSYGEVGNDNLGSFSYFYQQNYGTAGGYATSFGYSNNTFLGIFEGTLGNDQVTWETERKADLGLEFSMFKNKFSGTIDLFRNERFDIITNRGTISSVFGVGLPPVNLGKVRNQGGEVELIYRDRIGRLDFTIRGNYSLAKNKILFQDEPTQLYPYQALTGNSIGQALLYKWVGFYTSAQDIASSPVPTVAPRVGDLKYADINGDNKIDQNDMSVIGKPNLPSTNAGFELRLKYKDFGFNVLFQGAFNYDIRGVAESVQAFASNLTKVHQNSWTPELGDAAQYPLITQTAGISSPSAFPSTFWNIKGDYIRLKTAEISYSLPRSLTSRLKIQNSRVYINGYNLITWSTLNKLYAFDPEANTGSDRVTYPPQRMVNIGFSVTF